jgi:hypothetical protein
MQPAALHPGAQTAHHGSQAAAHNGILPARAPTPPSQQQQQQQHDMGGSQHYGQAFGGGQYGLGAGGMGAMGGMPGMPGMGGPMGGPMGGVGGGLPPGGGPPPTPRGPPLRTPSGGGLPRPGTGTSATYAQAKHAQLTLKDLETARKLMIAEIESNGECAQSALKDLVCILKQMGLHAEATTTIMQYRAAWPEDDRMQESLDNMLLDLFKHSRNLDGQIAVTGQLIAYSQKALAEGRTGWMIRTAGCKNTVSVHRRLSTLHRLRGQAQMQSGVWQEAEQSLLKALEHERLHVKEEDLSINIDRAACLIATGRLVEAQDLLLHVAATASLVIDTPHKGVGGSSVGTVRRVGLALKALIELLERFAVQVRKVADELERTVSVVNALDTDILGGDGGIGGGPMHLGEPMIGDSTAAAAAVAGAAALGAAGAAAVGAAAHQTVVAAAAGATVGAASAGVGGTPNEPVAAVAVESSSASAAAAAATREAAAGDASKGDDVGDGEEGLDDTAAAIGAADEQPRDGAAAGGNAEVEAELPFHLLSRQSSGESERSSSSSRVPGTGDGHGGHQSYASPDQPDQTAAGANRRGGALQVESS